VFKTGKYEEFRKKYPIFYYHGFDVRKKENEIFITYHFEIEGLMRFNPTLEVPVANHNYDDTLLNKIIFSAGLAEIPSYWKATCSPKIIISCGKLEEEETLWVKKLLYNGLGEFFYVNKIKANFKSFVSIESTGPTYDFKADPRNYDGYLVAVGGGKDSLVSLEILKKVKNKRAFIINNRKICFDGARIAGIKENDIINVTRLFDKNIIELNKQGFLNGHTPLSSCIAFISYLTAYVNGIKYVVLSNESSANEASVKGTNINHQYSKSFEFENDFRSFTNKYLTSKIEYFSLLRPLNEFQIMSIFTKHPKYFKHFISCNNGGKRQNIGRVDGWCLACPKCLFIYIIMSNFVDQKTMVSIFGENLLDKKEMLNYFLELLGKTERKPFECVGTVQEVTYVVNNLIKKGGKLPYLLEYYKNNYDLSPIEDDSILKNMNKENNVPKKSLKLVREALLDDRKNS